MPVKLEEMVKTFGLKGVEEKHFFPHLYNRTENLDVELPHLPQKDDYLYRSMMPKKKSNFDEWYESAKLNPFTLKEELASYCCADVS
jgi:hypothetical protein